MKLTISTLLLACFVAISPSFAQNKPLSEKDKEAIMSLPELKLPESHRNKSIPAIKDNSQEIFFRSVFQQAGMSCGQASSVGLGFNYEINFARNIPADNDTARYPSHFVFNWESDAYYGVSFYHTFDILRLVGTPNMLDYGGTNDALGSFGWMTGYDLYYNAMKNRIRHAYIIDVTTEEGMLTLKHWMNDHLNGSDFGGVANFYDGVPSASITLPAGTPEAGMYVVPNMYGSTSHAMTVVGYHDSIRYDYNNDGQYTNDIDITGDGIVDIKDWEIGGVKIANTYSGGPSFANNGFIYVMYKTIAEGGFWNGIVNVQEAIPDYEPQLTAKAEITYNKRKRLKITAGIASNLSSNVPEYSIEFPIFDYQGTDVYMTGGSAEADKTLEFGLDLTPLLNHISPGQEVKYFLIVTEKDADATGEGTINNFSIMDYTGTNPQEYICVDSDVSINNNTRTMLTVNHACNFEPPQITTTTLPPTPISAPFSAQMLASNGSEPYYWEFDPDFTVESQNAFLPTGGTSITANFSPVALGFDFPFYDDVYNTVYVDQNGMIVFESGFSDNLPYNDDDHVVFSHTRCIAPFYNTSTSWSVSKLQGTDYLTLIFDNTTIDYAVTLFDTGEIEFIYGNANASFQQLYTIGVSKGDNKTMQKLFFENITNLSDGFSWHLTPFNIPEDFEISQEGEITGTATQIYTGELIHIKVTDNNGLVDKIALPLISNGLIFETSVNTSDADTIVEYSEIVDLSIDATNPMDASLTNISVELQSSDPYITITDNSATLPDMAPYATESLTDAFQFTVAGNIPNNHEIELNYHTSSDQGEYDFPISLIGNAPDIHIDNLTIVDGNDGYFEASETGIVQIDVRNIGGADLNNINFILTNSESSIIINTDNTQLVELVPGVDSTIQFDVQAASMVPVTEINGLNIFATADNGFEQNIPFEVTVYSPALHLSSYLIDDNDNHLLDAGETTDINISLGNSAPISASNLDVLVTSTDPLVTINSGTASIPLINSDGTGDFLINLSIDEIVPNGYIAELNINIQNTSGYTTNISANIPVGILLEDFETGDLSSYEWENNDPIPWTITDQEVYQGNYAIQSGTIEDGDKTVLLIGMDVTNAGEISFARKVSSQTYYDFLDFMIDDEVQTSWSGEMDWEVFSFMVDPGYHEFKWRYRKNFSTSDGQDAAWVDSIVFPPVMNIPPNIQISSNQVTKVMYADEQDNDTIILSNAGAGHLHYDIWLDIDATGKSVKNIEGSEIIFNTSTYVNGENSITATVNNTSSDSEWLKTINIMFPGGTEVISSTDFIGGSGGALTSNSATGHAVEIEWTCDGWGNIHGSETATSDIVFNVSDGMSEDLAIPYSIYGDIYGSDPHEMHGEVILSNTDNQWLNLDHFTGDMYYEDETDLILHFNSNGLTPGFYYGTISITHNNGQIEIPVSLQILNPVNVENLNANNQVSIYPNPAKNNLTLNVSEGNIQTITICNMQGQCIYQAQVNSQQETINLPTEWSNGLYMVEIKTNKLTAKHRFTIMR